MCAHSVVWHFQKFRAAFPSFLRCHLSLSVPILPSHGRENRTDSKASLRSLLLSWCPCKVSFCSSWEVQRGSLSPPWSHSRSKRQSHVGIWTLKFWAWTAFSVWHSGITGWKAQFAQTYYDFVAENKPLIFGLLLLLNQIFWEKPQNLTSSEYSHECSLSFPSTMYNNSDGHPVPPLKGEIDVWSLLYLPPNFDSSSSCVLTYVYVQSGRHWVSIWAPDFGIKHICFQIPFIVGKFWMCCFLSASDPTPV